MSKDIEKPQLAPLVQHLAKGIKKGKMQLKFKFNGEDLLSGFRTAGALMVGNSFVVPVIIKSNEFVSWFLLIFGFLVLLATSSRVKGTQQ
jgi:hypothetical protein